MEYLNEFTALFTEDVIIAVGWSVFLVVGIVFGMGSGHKS